MIDMKQTIIAKSDQLNADDLIGGGVTIKVTKVTLLAGEQPVAVHYEGDNGKPWKPCKSMRRVLVGVWGGDGSQYIGRSLTLFRDPSVSFGGQQTGGIRISHMSDISEPITMSLTASRNSKRPFRVLPLVVAATSPAVTPVANSEEVDIEQLLIDATESAKGGTTKLLGYWNTLKRPQHVELQPYMERLKKSAAEIDAAIAADPFGLPPIPSAQPGDPAGVVAS